jgi:eukaryotic-like serine/threonine-protein kinase
VYSKLAAVNPRYRDVSAKIASIDAETRGSAMVFGKIVREDAAFRGEQGPAQSGRAKAAYAPTESRFPDLPELPPLPTLPSPAQRPGHAAPVGREGPTAAPPRRAPPARTGKSDATFAAVSRAAGRPPRAPARVEKSDANLTGVPASREEIKPGNLVAKRYQIQEKLGEGGMAVVYKATDLELNEVIALKVFTAGAEDAQLLARFKRELTLSRQLVHPNIVRLYDIGTHHGHKFITMELLTGTDLHARMKVRLEPVRAIHYLVEACAGLNAVHERGVVHRDIKPSNFFVTTEDVLKVMDFGIAKGEALAERLTISGFLAGTPLYMSPDQINHFGSVTHLSDLYSLGVVAYELFTGSVPFYHNEMGTLLMMHLSQPPEPPRAKNPQIPDELESIILQLLEKDPARRIQSCRELGRDLAEIGRGLAARRRR